MNLPLNKRCAEMLTSVSAFYAFLASAKKTASFMERREMCQKIPCI